MRIVAADGKPVEALQRKEILHAVAETYDIVLTLPDNKQYEFRATAQDGTGFSRVLIGSGELQAAEDKPRPNLYASHGDHGKHNNHAKKDKQSMKNEHAMHQAHNSNSGHGMHLDSGSIPEKEWDYSLLQSESISTLPEGKVRDVELRLTGDMESYNWSFDDIPLSRADKIRIKQGEVVRFHFINETMMHHPLHLHGHFFRVLTGNGDYEPIKHTVNVKPMAKTTIEFYANEEKDWFFHCHNLYHAKTGMARVVSYREPGTSQEEKAFMEAKMQSNDIKDSDFYFKGHVKLFDDYAEGSVTVSNYLHEFSASVESFGYEYELGELEYQYRWNRWLKPTLIGEADEADEEVKVGFSYNLPLLIELGLFYSDEQETVWEVESEFQLTSRIKSHLEYGSEDEMHYGFEYRFNEQLSAEIAYINSVRYVGGLHYRF